MSGENVNQFSRVLAASTDIIPPPTQKNALRLSQSLDHVPWDNLVDIFGTDIGSSTTTNTTQAPTSLFFDNDEINDMPLPPGSPNYDIMSNLDVGSSLPTEDNQTVVKSEAEGSEAVAGATASTAPQIVVSSPSLTESGASEPEWTPDSNGAASTRSTRGSKRKTSGRGGASKQRKTSSGKRGGAASRTTSSRRAAAQHIDVSDEALAAAGLPLPRTHLVAAEANRILSLSLERGDVTDAARSQLSQIAQAGKTLKEQVDGVRAQIAALPTKVAAAAKQDAVAVLAGLPAMIELAKSSLEQIERIAKTVVLRPEEYALTDHVATQLEMYQKQVELYKRELEFMSKMPSARPPNALSLYIVSQPFPQAFMYRKKLQTTLVCKLLTGALADFLVAPLSAEAVSEHPTALSSSTRPLTIDHDRVTLDNDGIATFKNVSFSSGSRKLPVRLKFIAEIDDPNHKRAPFKIESQLSRPFVVMTHENQWVETVGSLLRATLFPANVHQTSWQHFANVFQHHVVRTTRQDVDRPLRPLTLNELAHFHRVHFGRKAFIDATSFDKFWKWFGPALNRLHFKRHLSPMWADGSIAGFMSRADADAILKDRAIGVFLIRFSDTRPGQLVISYVGRDDDDGPYKHFLVQPHFTDERAFPDSLKDWPQFKTLLMTPAHRAGVPMSRERTFVEKPKYELLMPYYSKKKGAESGAAIGYLDAPS